MYNPLNFLNCYSKEFIMLYALSGIDNSTIMFFQIIFLMFPTIIAATICDSIPGWYHWEHETIYSKQLCCPNTCKNSITETLPDNLRCCFGSVALYWEIFDGPSLVGLLSVEYTRRNGIAYLINENESSFMLFKVFHIGGFLQDFPSNVCYFQGIVEINFSDNQIQKLSDMQCLVNLDKLNLDQNKIKYISNETFTKLPHLRILCLRHNYIKYIEPKSFIIEPGSLMFVYLAYNELESIDVTNLVLEKFFNLIDYSYNKLQHLKNELNWMCCKDAQVQGGYLDIRHNKFTHFPNLTEAGFKETAHVSKLVTYYGFDIRYNNWSCDCLFWPFLGMALQFYDSFPAIANQYNASCSSPTNLKNFTIPALRKNNRYDLLTCNLSISKKCPIRCVCYTQPTRNRTVIDCSSQNITEVRYNIMPDFDNLEVDFSNNKITQIKKHNYFSRVTKFNYANNSLINVDFRLFDSNKLALLNLLYNPIVSLDKSVQKLHICAVWIGKLTMKCDCSMIWLKSWLLQQEQKGCQVQNQITCRIKNELINATSTDIDNVCVEKGNTWIFTLIFALISLHVIFIWGLVLKYRYEFYLLYRKWFKWSNNKVSAIVLHDAYISFDVEIYDLRLWVTKILVKYLEAKGFKIFYPPRDCQVGESREAEVCREINNSGTFIVILSHTYLEMSHLTTEWKYIWNTFRSDSAREIILINYDELDIKVCQDERIKAFMRLGCSTKFFNMNKSLIVEIENKISRRASRDKTGLNNRHVIFSHSYGKSSTV